MHRQLIAFAALAIALGGLAAVAACASVADLDVDYSDGGGAAADAQEDSRQKVRESSTEPKPDSDVPITPLSTTFPCDGGLGPEETCDNRAGKGCCVGGSTSTCMEQSEATSCTGVFVGCRQGDPDTPCCWTTIGGKRVARFASDCSDGGGTTACIDEAGCPENVPCATKTCGDGFMIGQCGATPPECP